MRHGGLADETRTRRVKVISHNLVLLSSLHGILSFSVSRALSTLALTDSPVDTTKQQTQRHTDTHAYPPHILDKPIARAHRTNHLIIIHTYTHIPVHTHCTA